MSVVAPSPQPPAPSLAWLPWILLGAFAALWAARWPSFPLALDPYYHLLVARQVADAGGPLVYEWWEYAPVGRPHVYPPVLHLLLAALLRAGLSPLAAIRVATVVLPVGLLTSLYLSARRLAGPAVALAALGIALTPFTFHLHSGITLAATLAMCGFLWLIVALEEDRPLAAGLLMALIGYTHLGLPVVALVAVISHAAARGLEAWRRLGHAAWGALLILPWWVHLATSRPGIRVTARWENEGVEVLPLLLMLAAIGMWRCVRERGRLTWFAAGFAGFLVLAPRHLYRWMNGEGVLALLLLGGVGLSWAVHRLPPRRRGLGAALAAVVLILAPAGVRTDEGWQWRWPDAAPWHLLGSSHAVRKLMDATFISPQMEHVVADVQQWTQPDEILWSNAPYALGLVAALAGRPMSSAMLNEVGPARAFDPIRAAHLVVFFKVGDPPGWATHQDLAAHPLSLVAERELAVLYRQAGVAERAKRPRAVLPLGAALAAFGLALGAVVWDLARTRQAAAIPL